MLYEMLMGRSPFEQSTKENVFKQIRKGAYETRFLGWQDASREARDLIDKFLVTDPDARITLEDALNHDWFKKCLPETVKGESNINPLLGRNFINYKPKNIILNYIHKKLIDYLSEAELSAPKK
mmetsp:Transcript_11591/g.10106  ORF Transcript_11591/g.10106 Transcript_11591/m.10106 type:complete len:124 (+) Transcript_11591:810-1181(+)